MITSMSGSNVERHPINLTEEKIIPPRSQRVVILEDDQFLAHLYELVLAKLSAQYQIQKFTDADEAWLSLAAAPDLFITDVEHPGTDAWAVLERLAAKKVTFPILVISDEFQPGVVYQQVYPGMKVTLLSKPFVIQTLFKCLLGLLEHPEEGVKDCNGPGPIRSQAEL